MKKTLLAVSIFCLCGCITKNFKGGVPIRPHQKELIANAKTKQDVYEILGSPSAQNFVGEEKWFYYTSAGEVFAFLDPKFSKYEILSIGFDSEDNITSLNLNNLKDSSFAYNTEDSTQLPSNMQLNFFQELFGNIGRFNSSGITPGN